MHCIGLSPVSAAFRDHVRLEHLRNLPDPAPAKLSIVASSSPVASAACVSAAVASATTVAASARHGSLLEEKLQERGERSRDDLHRDDQNFCDQSFDRSFGRIHLPAPSSWHQPGCLCHSPPWLRLLGGTCGSACTPCRCDNLEASNTSSKACIALCDGAGHQQKVHLQQSSLQLEAGPVRPWLPLASGEPGIWP